VAITLSESSLEREIL